MRAGLLALILLACAVPCFAQKSSRAIPARVRAEQELTLSAEISARVEAKVAPRNGLVERGAVILKLDDRLFRAKLDQARADLMRVRAEEEFAKREYDRTRRLAKAGSVQDSVLDRQRMAVQVAEAARHLAEARMREAELMLERTVIRSPISGLLSQLPVEVGELVVPGQQLARVLGVGSLVVECFLTPEAFQGFDPKAPVVVRSPAASKWSGQGRVIEAAPHAGPERTHRIVVRVAALPAAVRAGSDATILLPESR